MPASLWLVPYEDNPFNKSTQELISETVPTSFSHTLKGNSFIPHVTLSSQIKAEDTYEAPGQSPQKWLDALSLPDFRKETDEVILELDHLEAGDPFYRKLVIEVNHNANLVKLAAQCRAEAVLKPSSSPGKNETAEQLAQEWANGEYKPHMSLLYADLPKEEVRKKVPLVESQVGFAYGDLFACCGGALCLGGSIVLVDTNKPLSEWQPIAKRDAPWVIWRMSRNLG